jgi:predicted nucleic acid-binding protein
MDAVTNVEVFQEILYRFHALKRPDDGIELSVYFRECVPNALPVVWNDIEMTLKLMHQYKGLKPRDALHAGVMLSHGITQICSADKDFDRIKEIERIDPLALTLPSG